MLPKDIAHFFVEKPKNHTIFGFPEDFDALPQEHQDQIFFLNSEASKLLHNYVKFCRLLTGPPRKPFDKSNFREIVEIALPEEEEDTKKWLYQRKIPFKNWVFILPNFSQHPVYLTWKMVVKYGYELFFADDLVIFDQSGNWCLVYFHEDCLYFGRHITFNSEIGYQQMEELYKIREQFPKFSHPLLPKKDT